MTFRFSRLAAAIAASTLVASAIALASPVAHAASGALELDPTSGTGADPLSVVTSGGCASPNATHFVVKLTGSGVKYDPKYKPEPALGPGEEPVNYMVGLTSLEAIGSTGSSTSAMRVPLGKLFDQVKAENKGGTLPSGAYTLTFECRAKLVPTAISAFSTVVTITNGASGLTFKEGAPEAIRTVSQPKVKGKARVGATLKVSRGTYSPKPSKIKVTWKIGKKTVSAGTSYKVKPADRGKTIKVTVTASKKGYVAASWVKSIKVAK
ncbi:MAG: hypothetical protein RLZZ163_61 [Actinomycetota bacterium]|jgi:hypothetical protein